MKLLKVPSVNPIKFMIGISSVFLIVSCQQAPTTVGVTEGGILLQDRDYRKAIPEQAVLFDTRSPFEFNTNRVPGSINLIPSDFVVKRDPLDAARRLALYGVTPDTPVVILGESQSQDDAKLAWEFAQLGLQKIETLKVQVFRTLNARIEPAKKNVTIWKPQEGFGEISVKEFREQLRASIPKASTGARVTSLQSAAAARALQDRILVIQVEGQEQPLEKSTVVFERKFEKDISLFDAKGLLKANTDWSDYLKRFDRVYLLDKSDQKSARAFALTRWGAKSLYLVY